MTSRTFFVLLLACVGAEEVATPSSLLSPRSFNHHAFDAKQFLAALQSPETTKQGPVLFPNDAPPPPRPPLIVTSRPLLESIARSELNNNSIPQSSRVSNIVMPFLARVKEYRPFQYYVATAAPTAFTAIGNGHNYEEHTTVSPIYKVLSDHAKQKIAKLQHQKHKNRYDYQEKEPAYSHYKNGDIDRYEDADENNQNKNYAFSYRVKDQKTGDDFSHSQHSTGSATNGEYRVRLPDGRMQIVSYTADENGYQANVRYDDEDKTVGNRIDNHHTDNQNDNNDNHYRYHDNHNHIKNNNNHINNKYYNDYSLLYNDKNDYDRKTYKPSNDKFSTPTNNDYYSDLSKEYYNDDFSSEYDSKNYDYAPHRSKFSSFIDAKADLNTITVPKTNIASGSTVTPSYDDLKDLLVTKKAYNTIQPYATKIPFAINSPSTTPSAYDFTTERVVVIGGKKNLYTSISNSVPLVSTAAPVNYNSNFIVSSTPRNYLISTIANLRNEVDLSGSKPILSKNYLERINKYIRYN